MEIPNIYRNKHYKKLLAIPLLLVLASLFFIPQIPQGVDLKGGSLITVYAEVSPSEIQQKRAELQAALAKFSTDVSVRSFQNPSGNGYEIEVGASDTLDAGEKLLGELKGTDRQLSDEIIALQYMEANEPEEAKVEAQEAKVEGLKQLAAGKANEILKLLDSPSSVSDGVLALQMAEQEYQNAANANREQMLGEIRAILQVKSYTSKEIGASLSRFFFSKTVEIVLLSFIMAALVVFAIFRGLIASVAVLFGAFSDIVVTAGVMGLVGIPLSLATVAALLMLIGFSIDTDMLLTMRGLKRTEGEAKDRVFDAMKTAFVMNTAALASFSVLVIVASMLQISTYYQIGIVAVIGALIDFIVTWAGNGVLVVWYSEVREAR